MERLEKRHEGSRLRGIQILSVSRHIATTLEHLPDELISRQFNGDRIERRPPISPALIERMAVAALFRLEDQGSLALQCGTSIQESGGNRSAAPRIHDRAPRRMAGQVGEGT